MQEQLRVLRAESKGKSSSKASSAADELQYLMSFNSSITQAAAKSMEHLSEFVFISMGNLTLPRRDAYLSHLRTGIKPDTLTALRSAPLHISTLFPDSAIRKAEEDITQFEAKAHTRVTPRVGTTHMNAKTRGQLTESQGQINQLGRLLAGDSLRKQRNIQLPTDHDILLQMSEMLS